MEGEGGKKGVRRPMNAFLIFCKRHRSKVREKNPEMDNRSITRVLGDLWTKLGGEEKATFTNLAKQYKDAFMKANPDYKWHTSDKVPGSSGSVGGAMGKLGAVPKLLQHTGTSANKTMATTAAGIHVNPEVTPGKLADPDQMGGLNLLLMAGKESNLMPHHQKVKPSSPPSSSSLFFTTSFASLSSSSSSALSSALFSTTPFTLSSSSTPASIPTKPYPVETSRSLSSVVSFPPSSSSFSSDAVMSSGAPIPQTEPNATDMTDQEANSVNSALLQLAEMCTTELYSADGTVKKAKSSSKTAVSPPKKRAKEWDSSSSPKKRAKEWDSSSSPKKRAKEWDNSSSTPSHPLKDENGQCQSYSSVAEEGRNLVSSVVRNDANNIPLDLSQPHHSKRVLSTKISSTAGRLPEQRKRSSSFSATDSASSESQSPVHLVDSQTASFKKRRLNSEDKFLGPESTTAASTSVATFRSAELNPISSTVIPLMDQSITGSGSDHVNDSAHCCLASSSCPIKSPCSSNPETNQPSDVFHFSAVPHLDQPFTQGKLKKRWTQRNVVETQRANEQRNGNAPTVADRFNTTAELRNEMNGVPSINVSSSSSQSLPLINNFNTTVQSQGISSFGNPLPPLNTCESQHNTLYRALTSQISPPRQFGPRMSSNVAHDQKIFKPIATCGKMIVDHIVERLYYESKANNPSFSNVYSSMSNVKPEAVDSKSVVNYTAAEEKAHLTEQSTHVVMRDLKPSDVKQEEMCGTFPAFGLDKQTGDPQFGKGEMCTGIPKPGYEYFSNLLMTSNSNGLTTENNGTLKGEKMEDCSDISKASNDMSVDQCSTPEAGDDLNSAPVRKSLRANRGQRYQTLIKEGIIQPSKERLAARNCAPKIVRSFSSRDGSDVDTGRGSPTETEALRSVGIVRELSEPAQKSHASDFDLEKEIASLPVCSLAKADKRRAGKRHNENENDAGRALTPLKENIQGSTSIVKDGREIIIPNDIHKSAQFILKQSEYGCLAILIPLPRDKLSSQSLTGSRKRKARRTYITRITVFSEDETKDPSVCTSSPAAAIVDEKKSLVGPSSDLDNTDGAKRAKMSYSAFQDSLPSHSNGETDLAKHGAANWNPVQANGALNSFTSATIESERAAFPSLPKSPLEFNNSVSSHVERSDFLQQSIAKQLTEPVRDSMSLVKSGPAFVPQDLHINNFGPEASIKPTIVSHKQNLVQTSNSFSSPATAYSSQLLQSISSTLITPISNQSTPLLQAMNAMAPDTLASLNNPAALRPDLPKQHAISPYVLSTLPPVSGFQQNRLKPDPKQYLPAARQKSVPLKVPVPLPLPIVSSFGDGANLRKTTPPAHDEQYDRGMKTDKEVLFSQSKKLVKLLLDDAANKPSVQSTGDASVNHQLHNKKRPAVKRVRSKPPVTNAKQQASVSQVQNLATMKGLQYGKLFSAQGNAAPILNDAKKHKPTIWDHLSSQCPVAVKAAPSKDQVVPLKPVHQPLILPPHATTVVSTTAPKSERRGSDTDSANEDNGQRRSDGSSDTDSADEKEELNTINNNSSSVPSYSQHLSNPITSRLLAMALQPKTTIADLETGSATTRQPQQQPTGLSLSAVTPTVPQRLSLPAATPAVCSTPTTALLPSSSSCDKDTNLPSSDSSSLLPSFVPISSITLPSDIPESDLLSSLPPSSSTPSPPQSKLIVKTISPSSSFPCTHVTDLSSAPDTSVKVSPASCILLSTLQKSSPLPSHTSSPSAAASPLAAHTTPSVVTTPTN